MYTYTHFTVAMELFSFANTFHFLFYSIFLERRVARKARRRYLIYSEVDFSFFFALRGGTLHRWTVKRWSYGTLESVCAYNVVGNICKKYTTVFHVSFVQKPLQWFTVG